ncbi:MAG TPA: hypothetical protein VE441_09805 [Mycobacterium sp.]|nr:hypothetical protein [Mycobacterium sp.]
MAFTDGGIEYAPAGVAHAVDVRSAVNGPDALLGYAICGAAVRVWRDRAFEADAPDAHEQCAAITRGG